ncbi:Hypothetical protein D9617_18g033460 [Elsinoe fawcettii]|nr:Hypothetical protein D9617_18g033460 [Elsinoe fawcettii]
MSSACTVVSPGEKIFEIANGSKIGPNKRFEIIGLHHSSKTVPCLLAQTTYVAKDVGDGRHIILTILSDDETARTELRPPNKTLQILRETPNADKHLLLPLDIFQLDTPSRNRCFMYELFGPTLQQQVWSEDTGLPANWIRKTFRDALSALTVMHSRGIVHGAIHLWSLVITYPDTDPTDEAAVLKKFQFNDQVQYFTFNGTGSGGHSWRPNLDFRVKLQGFEQAFVMTDQPRDHTQYQISGPFPPELHSKGPGPHTDIWYLASLITNFASGTPMNYHFLEDNPGLLSESALETKAAIERELQASRSIMRKEDSMIRDYGSGDFSSGELVLLADLLSRMLDADPSSRYTAQQALDHRFFVDQLPADTDGMQDG